MVTYVSPTVAAYYGVQPGEVLMTSGVGGFTASSVGTSWASSPEGQATYAAVPHVVADNIIAVPSVVQGVEETTYISPDSFNQIPNTPAITPTNTYTTTNEDIESAKTNITPLLLLGAAFLLLR